MSRKDFFNLRYITILMVVWGNLFWLIDFPLAQAGFYESGSTSQARVAFLSCIFSLWLSRWLLPMVTKRKILVSDIYLNTKNK